MESLHTFIKIWWTLYVDLSNLFLPFQDKMTWAEYKEEERWIFFVDVTPWFVLQKTSELLENAYWYSRIQK